MKKIKKRQIIISFTLLVMIFFNFSAQSQQSKIGLSIGDRAPQLSYSKVVKGEKAEIIGDKVYVLEFWATWCVPCIAAMPHLSELAEQHKDDVKVIAVNVFERTSEQPYSVIVPKVTEFVETATDKMRFTVVVDDDERNMEKQWLRKAGITGIPATIIVKEGKIYWIGHPMFVDKVLKEITDGSYDLDKRKSEYERKFIAEREESNRFKENMSAIENAIEAGKYKDAIALTDKISLQNPESSYPFKQRKLQILITFFKDKDVLKYLNQTLKNNKKEASALASFIAGQKNISRKVNSRAAEILDKYGDRNTYYLDCLANLHIQIGQFGKAYENQLQMLNLLIETQKDKPDLISDEVININRKKVDEYKNLAEKHRQI